MVRLVYFPAQKSVGPTRSEAAWPPLKMPRLGFSVGRATKSLGSVLAPGSRQCVEGDRGDALGLARRGELRVKEPHSKRGFPPRWSLSIGARSTGPNVFLARYVWGRAESGAPTLGGGRSSAADPGSRRDDVTPPKWNGA